MKQTFRFIVKIMVAAIVAACVALAVDALGIGYRFGFVSVFFATAIGVAALLGAFREEGRKRARFTSIKDAARYGQAAIFLGTACLYVGEPKECEQLADDLWHRGQQVHVDAVTDGMEFSVM